MSFDARECLDCPLPVLKVLLFLIGGLVTFGVGVALVRRDSRLGLALAVPVLALSVTCYMLLTFGVLRFGILWNPGVWYPPDQPALWRLSRAGDLLLLASWYLATVLIFWSHRRRMHPVPPPASAADTP